MSSYRRRPAVIVHGGAWSIPDDEVTATLSGVKTSVIKAFKVLEDGGTALDAVQTAVEVLEDDPVFDAGRGSVLNAAGEVEMDAIIMDGRQLEAGAVACIHNIIHPIQLARLVMEKTTHTLLVGKGADDFAREQNIDQVDAEELVTESARREMYAVNGQFDKTINRLFSARPGCETVGAAALDIEGNVAFATSTGGITAKRPGRVGDSPIIGAGGYADNDYGACSATGKGESISKVCLSYRTIAAMQSGISSKKACEDALKYMSQRVGGNGGLIVVDAKTGLTSHSCTTERMAWASIESSPDEDHGHPTLRYGIEPDDDHVESIPAPAW